MALPPLRRLLCAWIAATGVATTGGCDRRDPLRPGDVACFDDRMGNLVMGNVPFWRAKELCAPHRLPDLTGDERMQEEALLAHEPFQVQPHLDARLKYVRRWENVPIGSNIGQSYVTYVPDVTVEEHDTSTQEAPAPPN